MVHQKNLLKETPYYPQNPHRASVDSLGCEDGRRQEFVSTAYYNLILFSEKKTQLLDNYLDFFRQEFVSTAYYNGQKMALKLINVDSINLNR